MRARRRALPASVIVGALLVTSLAVVALAVVRPSTGAGVPVRAVARPVEPAPTTGDARTGPTEPSLVQPFVAHTWMPRSVPIGGDRQLRVQIWDGTPAAEPGQTELLRVTFGSDDRRFSVRPAVRIVARGQLRDARFAIAARADLRCEDEPAGTLAVTVTSLLDPDRTTSTQVALPGLDCRAAPPEAPASVHVTEAVCGGDHAEQVSRLLEGEELDPRRCASHRWRNGEPRPWPPPRPAPRPPPPAADTGDRATAGDDPADATEGGDPADATEGGDPGDADAAEGDDTDRPGEDARAPDADGPEDAPAGPPEQRDGVDGEGQGPQDREPGDAVADVNGATAGRPAPRPVQASSSPGPS